MLCLLHRRGCALALFLFAFASAFALAGAPASADPVRSQQLSCLTPDRLQGVKEHPRTRFPSLYAACVPELRAALGPAFADLRPDALHAAFATVVAHELAGYGASGVYDLPTLLARQSLDCASYTALAWHLDRVGGGVARHLRVIGWDRVPGVGNHAQLAYAGRGQKLILDPTIGLVARAGYEAVLAGQPVPSEHMASFPKAGPEGAAVDALRAGVIDDLYRGGAFTPATAIYVQEFPPGQGAVTRTRRVTSPARARASTGPRAPSHRSTASRRSRSR